MVVYAFKQHKTNQKTHANQLISGKFCSFPAVITVAMSQYYLHGLVANPSGTPSIRILPWLNYKSSQKWRFNQLFSLPDCPLMICMPQSQSRRFGAKHQEGLTNLRMNELGTILAVLIIIKVHGYVAIGWHILDNNTQINVCTKHKPITLCSSEFSISYRDLIQLEPLPQPHRKIEYVPQSSICSKIDQR